jgi:hypothetical protein
MQRSDWLGTHSPFIDWCYAAVDRALGLQLREEESSMIIAPGPDPEESVSPARARNRDDAAP